MNEYDYELLYEYNYVYGISEYFYELVYEFIRMKWN